MALAILFGGLRISSALSDAGRLRLAADRVELVPSIINYLSALDNVLVSASSDGDTPGANKNYESRKHEIQSQLADADVAADVRSGVTTVIEDGQALLDRVLSNSIGLRDEVTDYAPILLTAEDAIDGAVRVDDERIRADARGLSRAVGARGQMMMQQLLVNRGGELPEPELRTAMTTVAGTEPSTLFGMSEVLGVDSPDAKTLQQQLMTRLAIVSDPDAVLPNNPALQDSIQLTDGIAAQMITATDRAVTDSVQRQATDLRDAATRDIVLVLGAIVAALAVMWLLARSLVRPLRTLRDGALRVAHTELERGIARVQAGSAGMESDPEPLPVYTTEEIGQVAHAVDELHTQALLLAGDEARLRLLVNDMFETMSRRNRSLVEQQLSLIDRLERDEDNPDRLDSLFRLDHLAARMRRNGANLLVLAGARSHEQGRPLPLSTVISAATSEVEDYRRVETGSVPDVTLPAAAGSDTIHLLAELIDNALRYSPPTATVWVSAEIAADAGVLIEVADTGLGMTDTDLRMANTKLEGGGEVTPENARHMGLFVVSRLAHRHGIRVWLSRLSDTAQGITAEVQLSPSLLADSTADESPAPGRMPVAAVGPAPDWVVDERENTPEAVQRNGSHADTLTTSLLPRRSPGSSGISAADEEAAQGDRPAAAPRPADTSAYFSSRSRVESGVPPSEPAEIDALAVAADAPDEGDLIYQRMLSDWLVDPHELAHSADLDWKTVWDHGWSMAADVEQVPVAAHTEQGLPVREPGARLVPGAPDARPSETRDDPEHPGAADGTSEQQVHEPRDPDAVRASIGHHFDGVRAARSQARETDPEQNQGPDHE